MGTSASQPSEQTTATSRLSTRNPIASPNEADMLRGNRSNAAAAAASASAATAAAGGDAGNHSSGSSASAQSTTPPISPKTSPPLYCYIKAKTRIHNSTKVVRRSTWYEAKHGSSSLIGRGDVCDLKLDDDRCALVNAKLAPSTGTIPPAVVLTPEARTYRLVGMGLKRHVDSNVITLGSVIKVGSVSLEVTGLCTDENDDFAERFGVEINTSYGETGRRASSSSARNAVESVSVIEEGRATGAEETGGVVAVGGTAAEEDEETRQERQLEASANGEVEDQNTDDDNDGGDTPSTLVDGVKIEVSGGLTDDSVGSVEERDEEEEEEEDEAMCYICWGGVDAELDVDEDAAVAAAAAVANADGSLPVKKKNPLIRNPCGKCSGSSQFVHLNCILTWIESSGSGHCSICNGPLPPHFSSPPPNIELKVVRHRRGHSWVGTRRYRISFSERKQATIGRESEADVRLGDRSVCGMHARITFDTDTRQFLLSDCGSLTGTYLQVRGPTELVPQVTTYLKIGRTLLSLRVTHKRNSILHHMLPSGWKR